MHIDDLRFDEAPYGAKISARVRSSAFEQPKTLWFRYSGAVQPRSVVPEPFISALLPLSMWLGEACTVDAPLARATRRNLDAAQAVLTDWYGALSPVSVEDSRGRDKGCQPPGLDEQGARGVVCSFSGGVDSWYSLLENRDRVTHLLLVRGFDIGLDNDELWESTMQSVRHVAEERGLGLVTCETNLRAVADPRRSLGREDAGDFWGRKLHGAALAACVQPLGEAVSHFIIPATHTADQLRPWGSSPKLDPLWSTDDVAIEHHGCEADRLGKVRSIATDAVAVRNLRVCHNDLGRMNCCRCEKCVRTMLALHLCSALDRAQSFPDHTALSKIQRMAAPPHVLHHYEALREKAHRVGDRATVRRIDALLGHRISWERLLARAYRSIRDRAATMPHITRKAPWAVSPRRKPEKPMSGDRV